jgi:Protein of unknown function (DUF1071)
MELFRIVSDAQTFTAGDFIELSKYDISKYNQTANDYKYLSWTAAMGVLFSNDNNAIWELMKFENIDEQGNRTIDTWKCDNNLGYMVGARVCFKGVWREMLLSVSDEKNNAMKNHEYSYKTKRYEYKDNKKTWTGLYDDSIVAQATMRDIEDTQKRVFVKCLAMFGIGIGNYLKDGISKDFLLDTQKPPKEITFIELLGMVKDLSFLSYNPSAQKVNDLYGVYLNDNGVQLYAEITAQEMVIFSETVNINTGKVFDFKCIELPKVQPCDKDTVISEKKAWETKTLLPIKAQKRKDNGNSYYPIFILEFSTNIKHVLPLNEEELVQYKVKHDIA